MSSDVTAIDQIKETDASEAQVVAYLRAHPEFF
ncbi:MAG: hypothetical protein ACJATW_002183, partial [Glaciecola sp.]